MTTQNTAKLPHPGLSFAAFVTLMAGFMALNGLAVDTMLPALPAIGDELGVTDPNDRQWVITAYFLGFGIFQLFYGPLSDRFGRRPVLLFGVSVYAFFSIVTVFVSTFDGVVVTRFLQGAGSAATRVLVVAIVRDCYSGRQMAKVMSLAFIIFLTVPVLAPAIGQGIMLFVSWHWIFLGLALFAVGLTAFAWVRLPETLHPEYRLPLSMKRVLTAFKVVTTTRQSIGYSIAMTLVLGPLFGYIASVQQIFADVFQVEALFTVYFAVTAISMAIASFVNSRVVERLGTRLVSHSAMCGMLVCALLGILLETLGYQNLYTFVVLQSAIMFCFGLTAPNFGSMAMEPVGHIAGTASSVQGCITTVGAAVLGFLIGQAFDGTTLPLIGAFALLSASAIVVVLITEGRLFQPLHEAPVER
ncbi:multidrug effflux MFS transporter [Granulosicoccus antarcticus]|uniref:Bcr/CflA family efflux transporter n=1 Tax=Granulosicoccus antarcticus IMCC3135 TaxID=1192854 RepID=A0A2Z2NLK2_9GAMM|nr:multidrug effflux MFS transporter [Granulosicoccus antarcticus]ASJ72322.1 Bicyclomycin resistance protein [Granulosicoccus antarcticus IMCC3135]